MVEPLSAAAPGSTDPTVPDLVYVQMTYDAATGAVTYTQQQVSIATSTLLYLDLTTLNPGSGGDARFYGFTISANWPDSIRITFPSDPEMQLIVPLPATPSGSYSFMPAIQATGHGVEKQGTLQLTVANS